MSGVIIALAMSDVHSLIVTLYDKSLWNIFQSKGPRADPCGQPRLTVLLELTRSPGNCDHTDNSPEVELYCSQSHRRRAYSIVVVDGVNQTLLTCQLTASSQPVSHLLHVSNPPIGESELSQNYVLCGKPMS